MNLSLAIIRFLLSRRFVIGAALAITGYNYANFQYQARHYCQLELKRTIRDAEGAVQDLKIQLEKHQKQLEKYEQYEDRFKELNKKIEKLSRW
ncbi:MAG: hypothetical protein V4591_08155 [Bdellovibrionota bacterium]